MGSCVDKQKASSVAIKRNNQIGATTQQINPGLQIISGALTKVKFHHTPLESCPYLFQKFKKNASLPQQVNLTFMIQGAQINSQQNTVEISIINQNEINIYFILGGQQGLSSTGLTVQIDNAKYVEKINRKEPTLQKSETLRLSPPYLHDENVTLVIQPVLKDRQSMYIIYRYEFNPKQRKYSKKSQSLQWTNLAFNLQEIYGAQDEFKCNSGQVCAICLTNLSSIIITPCRHMCICRECSKAKEWKDCPICRSAVRALIQYG